MTAKFLRVNGSLLIHGSPLHTFSFHPAVFNIDLISVAYPCTNGKKPFTYVEVAVPDSAVEGDPTTQLWVVDDEFEDFVERLHAAGRVA